jgi:hypothetical protein
MVTEGAGPDREDWFGSYVGRVGALLAETARVNVELAAQWRERSLGADEWSVDTVTADMIEAWEQLTPLAGEGIELWLELVQRAVRPQEPT